MLLPVCQPGGGGSRLPQETALGVHDLVKPDEERAAGRHTGPHREKRAHRAPGGPVAELFLMKRLDGGCDKLDCQRRQQGARPESHEKAEYHPTGRHDQSGPGTERQRSSADPA